MKDSFLSNPIQRLKTGIFCLVLCANLALMLGLLAAFSHMMGSLEPARLFAGASLLAALESLWLGIRAARARVFLNYTHAAQVYYPGILISILLSTMTHFTVRISWDAERPFWILIFSGCLFMVVCLGIKLMNARHALD